MTDHTHTHTHTHSHETRVLLPHTHPVHRSPNLSTPRLFFYARRRNLERLWRRSTSAKGSVYVTTVTTTMLHTSPLKVPWVGRNPSQGYGELTASPRAQAHSNTTKTFFSSAGVFNGNNVDMFNANALGLNGGLCIRLSRSP